MSAHTLFSRADTSVCPHLSTLLDTPATRNSSGGNGDVLRPSAGTKRAEMERKFVKIVQWGAISQGAKRRKTAPPQCLGCSTSLSRPWACLTCSYVGCLPLVGKGSSSKKCMKSHWESSGGKCAFAADPSTGSIYCSACDDATYPDSFETLFLNTRIRVEETNDHSREGGTGKIRGRGEWKAWNPSNMVGVQEGEVTCFLSAILQALIHNPLLKAYFLSDRHNRHVCSNGGKGLLVGKPFLGQDNGPGNIGGDREKGCMCCELDRAFEEFYNEDKSPFGPVTMLWAMWHASTELEGYGQQDAHSFFLAALDQIHAHAKGQLSSCNCIAHQTFAGSLQSSVTCSNCSKTSTTIDPVLDIQLDFPSSSSSAPSDMTAFVSSGWTRDQLTLAGMLRKFCAAERVGDPGGKGYDCSRCGGGAGTVAMRQLGLKKLAPVLSFQLKRFAHSSSTTTSKIEHHVRFPSALDMRPYCSSSSDHSSPLQRSSPLSPRSSPEKNGNNNRPEEDIPDSLYLYDLFAVVTHEGKLDNGHYWADVRDGEEWWHCDDDKVTPTTLAAVLKQRAYMLFYAKRSLAYSQPMSKILNGGGNTLSG